ncbi:general substrate transporter [Apiospora arundinis]
MPADQKMAKLTQAVVRLHLLCIFFAIGSFVWGYNIGILASIQVHPGFVDEMGELTAVRRGVITAIYYVGTWTGYVFVSHPASDRLGRRYAALIGTAVLAVGTAFEAGATRPHVYAMWIVGRIICGLGVSMLSTSVPLYQAEIAPAGQRGKYVVLNHVGFVAGLASGFWVGYGVTFWMTSNSWRFSAAAVLIPAVIFAVGLPFLPETPRWLIEHNRPKEAYRSLHWLREGSFTNAQIEHELAEIQDSVTAYHQSGLNWLSLFRERHLRDRLWRASLLQFMAQMCGATAMKYYLPIFFFKLGLGHRVALLAGGIESTLKIGMTVIEMLLIDRLGRRTTLVAGCVTMCTGLLVNAVLGQVFPDNQSRAADLTCVVFIFVYAIGYSLGFGPTAWVYASEIFPTAIRARGLNFSASAGAIGSIVVAQVWPVGIDTIGPKIYYFFFAITAVCIPIIFMFYPETKGRTLEEMDDVFHASLLAPRHTEPVEEDEEAVLPRNDPEQN